MTLKNLIISLAVLLDPLFLKINVLKLSCVILKYFKRAVSLSNTCIIT